MSSFVFLRYISSTGFVTAPIIIPSTFGRDKKKPDIKGDIMKILKALYFLLSGNDNIFNLTPTGKGFYQ